MKKNLLIAMIAVSLSGCNMNPNKEARIQKLETEITQALDKLEELESRIQNLEGENAELKTQIHRLEGL